MPASGTPAQTMTHETVPEVYQLHVWTRPSSRMIGHRLLVRSASSLADLHATIERTFAWLGRCRIHSRDDERKTTASEAPMQISMIPRMLRRLSGENHETPFCSLRS